MSRCPPSPAGAVLASGVVVVLILEWWLFETSVRDYLLGTYPRHHDQTGYLNLAYANYEHIKDGGVWRALAQRLSESKPQGSLLDFEAALAFIFFEPNRLGALSVIFAHFAVLQIAAMSIVTTMTGTPIFGAIAVALLASSGFLFIVPGGLFDFRIDAAANCTYGIFVLALLRSSFYRNVRWSIATGVIGGYLIALRHNTVVHLAIVHAVFLPILFFADRRESGERGLLAPGTRLRGFAASVGSLALSGGPFLAIDFTAMANYYLGQFNVRAPVRNALSGRNAFKHLFFYPYAILHHHVRYLLPVWGALVGVLWVCRDKIPRRGELTGYPGHPAARPDPELVERYLPLAVTVLVPLAVLTLHSDRSPVVIGLTLTPIAVAATFLLQNAYERVAPNAKRVLPSASSQSRPMTIIAIAALVAGTGVHALQHTGWRSEELLAREEATGAFEMHYTVARTLYALGHRFPVYLPSTMEQPLEPGVAATPLFERDRIFLMPQMPSRRQQIFPVEETRFWRLLSSTDAVLLQTSGDSVEFPFTKFVRSIEPALTSRVRKSFVAVGEWSFGGYSVTGFIAPRVHLRPGFNLEVRPTRHGEIASFAVTLPQLMLDARPTLTLEGGVVGAEGPLDVRAAIGARPIPAEIDASMGSLRITVATAGATRPTGDPIELEIAIASRRPSNAPGASIALALLPTTGHFTVASEGPTISMAPRARAEAARGPQR